MVTMTRRKATSVLRCFSAAEITSKDLSLAVTAARGLEYAGEEELAADAYTGFGEIFRASDEEQISSYGERLVGAARRLRLPGNTLELKGTLLDGGELDWDSYRGKVVLVDFWATWCGPCIRAMPKLESLSRRYAGQVEVIAVNLDDAAKARSMFDDGGYRMTLVADDGQVSTRYGVSTIPHSVVIDREGVVRMVYRGGSSKLVADVEAVIGEEIRK